MNLNKKLSPVTFHYMIITGGFWMAFCVVTAYAAVYLQGVGCSNGELGLILALGNVGGALLSPVLGAQIDRNRSLRHAAVINVLLAIQVVLLTAPPSVSHVPVQSLNKFPAGAVKPQAGRVYELSAGSFTLFMLPVPPLGSKWTVYVLAVHWAWRVTTPLSWLVRLPVAALST